MRLIGKLDSPYVRRVAVALHLMEMPFDHDDLSVLRDYTAFAAVNPVVKAPTLVTDDGVTLLDSTLILDWLERLAPADRRLTPPEPERFARHQRLVGLALAACEKTVQTVYETRLRPDDKQHQPWIDRVGGQLAAAYRLLEDELHHATPWLFGDRPLQADIAAAVAWRFTRDILPDQVAPERHPMLVRLSEAAEALPVFRRAAPR